MRSKSYVQVELAFTVSLWPLADISGLAPTEDQGVKMSHPLIYIDLTADFVCNKDQTLSSVTVSRTRED